MRFVLLKGKVIAVHKVVSAERDGDVITVYMENGSTVKAAFSRTDESQAAYDIFFKELKG